MNTSGTALIVGAGIGGLATALALRRAGWQVRVFERAAAPRELGFALMLAGNAMAALRELGVADTVRAGGAVPDSVEICTTGGRVLRRLHASVAALPNYPVVALRSVLHGSLLDALGPAAITGGSEAVAFEMRDGGVTLHCAGGRAERGDLLVGADGVGSIIRRQLHPWEPPPAESAYCGLRGVAYGAEPHLGGLGALAYLGPGIEMAAVRAGADAIYWYVSLLAADLGAQPPVALRLRDRVSSRIDPRLQAIAAATRDEDLRFDRFLQRPPLEAWGRGRVTLAGDAAHPVLPHTGQGAAQALEDAVALGLALAGTDDVERALRRYESVRSGRTRAVIRAGPRIARVTTTRRPIMTALRDLVVRLVPAAAVETMVARRPPDPHRPLRNAAV